MTVDWFKYQIEQRKLIEGKDFTELLTKNVRNSAIKRRKGRPSIDYALTLAAG